ncbi:4-hydroxythreonine-4-phosphate dehydrogenase PdxA [Oscillatoria sp. FACHB-1406]|uniref:4-hydroxythreonine-4-phosphate dehydrogenase PdxA n=1 Tax=Oscillatoria sp. FACHB-1406 TaxID=2692846 RepID=UPI0016834250|nr:4-hydroxythreonine-4-phosphate dehydrogenase PdxA [Oscillatoria sp. FACHB-1406]
MIVRLAITIGDPAGIGAEVVLKALADPSIREKCQICLFGTRSLLEASYAHLKQQGVEDIADPQDWDIFDIPIEASIHPGKGDTASGAASYAYLEAAIARTLAGEFQGIVTAPIAKSLWKAAGYDYPGQTEVLAERAGSQKYGMLFVARSPHTGWTLRSLLATTHIPLRQVPDALSPELLTRKLDLLIDCLHRDFGIAEPRIAIAGLNPHSGEAGQLGTEERDWMNAWLESERKARPKVELAGLIPPDTMWVNPARAWYESVESANAADAFLALYHDQGLIPVKLMAFDRAINTTIGLPFIRTSPDHGTAFDIAGRGIASATSTNAAIHLAAELAALRMKS